MSFAMIVSFRSLRFVSFEPFPTAKTVYHGYPWHTRKYDSIFTLFLLGFLRVFSKRVGFIGVFCRFFLLTIFSEYARFWHGFCGVFLCQIANKSHVLCVVHSAVCTCLLWCSLLYAPRPGVSCRIHRFPLYPVLCQVCMHTPVCTSSVSFVSQCLMRQCETLLRQCLVNGGGKGDSKNRAKLPENPHFLKTEKTLIHPFPWNSPKVSHCLLAGSASGRLGRSSPT